MTAKVHITDGNGTGLQAHVHDFDSVKGNHFGLLTLQERFLNFTIESHPFLNDNFGSAMNQEVSFSGDAELIHDGGDVLGWSGVAVVGTWDFADTTNPVSGSACFSLTLGNNSDQATFHDATETDMSNYSSITGEIRLDTYNSVNNSIILQCQNNNVNVGTSVDLNNYIDPGVLGSYQNFVIPKADLTLSTQTIDEVDLTLSRAGGPKPTFRIDSFQLEFASVSSTPITFKSSTPVGTRYHIDQIRVSIVDALSGVVTNGTMHGLSYDKILNVSKLTNGIIFSRVQGGETLFSLNLKQLGDFLSSGSNIINAISDGINTCIILQIDFPEPIILEGGADSFLSFTINDDLSGLLNFTALARGGLEI